MFIVTLSYMQVTLLHELVLTDLRNQPFAVGRMCLSSSKTNHVASQIRGRVPRRVGHTYYNSPYDNIHGSAKATMLYLNM